MTKRRDFIKGMSLTGMAMVLSNKGLFADVYKRSKMKPGLVTYLWGKDWDVPTIIQNCEKSNLLGVELRTEHKHGVEPSLNPAQRKEVKARFANSKVEMIGYGSNVEFDSPDPAILKQNMDLAKELIKLSHDVGGSGVKVKPNKFHEGVPHEKTIEQIGKSLNEIGKFGKDYGQLIRLEVHGRETQELPNIKAIMDVADNRNVAVCWNSNPTDLIGKGLEYNFNLVKDRLGDTVHIHEMDSDSYPWQELMNLFVKMNYSGWMLWECTSDPADKVEAMTKNREMWEKLVANAQS
ncbi:MAG: TIM barrel protein [Cyclobacteriaceae bacterium]